MSLQGNSIGAAGCRHLAKALTTNASVTHVNLNGNPIGNEGGMAIAEMLYVRLPLLYCHPVVVLTD